MPDATKSERFARLLDVQNRIAAERNAAAMGTTVRVLCDGESKGDATVYSGRTAGNKIVFFAGEPSMVGRFVDVYVERTEPFALWGRVV